MPIILNSNVQNSQLHKVDNHSLKELVSKRLIVCYDTESNIVANVISTFNQLLVKYPQWSNNVALILFVPNDTPAENVYNFPNIDKDTRATLATSASVNIALNTVPDVKSSIIPTLVSHRVKASNQVDVNTLDCDGMAKILNNVLTTQPLDTTSLFGAYKNTQRRLFLFDYDGTLTPIVSNPADAQPTPTLLAYLKELCRDPLNTVWIISGRDQHFLDTYLGKIPRLGLSAEHGSFMKKAGLNDWVDMLENADMSWKQTALEIFEKYTSCNPGTVIEQKKSSITWHYRNAKDTTEATEQSKLCHQELLKIPGVDILVGKMNLEVRSLLVNKGEVVKRIKQQQESDFIMCAGDDQTDEDMFEALKDDNSAFCISVGPLTKITSAKYCVEHSEDVVNIIGNLVSNNSTL